MAYVSGDLILDDHYNIFVTGNADGTANVAVPNINSVWGTGNANVGYGQISTLSNVSTGTTVTSTQWSTLISRLNSILTHQLGSGSGITAPVTGDVISILNNLSTRLNSARANVELYASSGNTTVGTANVWLISAGPTTAISNVFIDTNVTFSSADSARYFFNAGGRLNLIVSATSGNATTRSTNLRDLINNCGGVSAFAQRTNGGRAGTGGTVVSNVTTVGYRTSTIGSPTLIVDIDSAPAAYTAQDVKLFAFTSGATTNGSNGNVVTFRLQLFANADDAFGGDIDLSITSRIDIINPETTNLTNVWGTPTITWDNT
jgi:hypothetical protein